MNPSTILKILPRLQTVIENLAPSTRRKVAIGLAVSSVLALAGIAVWAPQRDAWATVLVALLTLALGQFVPPAEPPAGGPPEIPRAPLALLLLLVVGCTPAQTDRVRSARDTVCRACEAACGSPTPSHSAVATPPDR